MERIDAPFNQEQIKNLNNYQQKGYFHPFTGPGLNPETGEPELHYGERGLCPDAECLLIATTKGFVCPCGKFTQTWAYKFMTKNI